MQQNESIADDGRLADFAVGQIGRELDRTASAFPLDNSKALVR
jgi:hypothetical protein